METKTQPKKELTAEEKRKRAEYQRAWRLRNLEKVKAIDKRSSDKGKYQRMNERRRTDPVLKQKYLEWSRQQYEKKWAHNGDTRIARKYELPVETVRQLREKPCEICGDFYPRKKGRGSAAGMVFDHDHTTGKFRGILCGKCNTAIGLLKENPELFEKASQYLLRK